MATMTDLVRGSRAERHAEPDANAASKGRDRAFRQAFVHTWVVRSLRILLPLTAVGMVAYYALSVRGTMQIAGVTLPEMPRITADNLTMDNPRYEGFNDDGSHFVVTAKTAAQDLMSRSAPIKLSGIDGLLVGADKTQTKLAAARGVFDKSQSLLELFEGINIETTQGIKARLARATIQSKEGIVRSDEPVSVEMPTGSIRANRMLLRQKQRHLTFSNGVEARLNPPPPKPLSTPTSGQDAKRTALLASSGAPVAVTSERLIVDDAKRIAVFQGGVRASQGVSMLASEELEIAYEGGEVKPAGAAKPGAAKADFAATSGRVRSIVSRTPVALTQNEDRVTAKTAFVDIMNETARLAGDVVMKSGNDRSIRCEVADLDQGRDTAVLSGRVHLRQGRNELKGDRLTLDRNTGRSELTGASGGKGRIWARFYQENGQGDRKAAKPRDAAPPPGFAGLGASTFKTDPDAPIEIEANRLAVDDASKSAAFRGGVVASQGNFRIATPQLTARYSGTAGLALDRTGNDAAARQRAAPAKLEKIEARGGVTVTSGEGQKASGDWADFDAKANKITLGGGVVLAQGKTVVRGSKLEIDLETGQSRILMDGPARTAAGTAPALSAVTSPADAQGPYTPGATGRPRAVFNIQQLRNAAKGGGADPATATATATPAAPAAPQARQPPPATDLPWLTTTPKARPKATSEQIFKSIGTN